jgi:dipeptide/tripeptide permease
MSDGVSNSLLSKKLPQSLALGFWNAGFLATVAGTSGRMVGSIGVTVAGFGDQSLISLKLFAFCSVVSILTVILLVIMWKQLNVTVGTAPQKRISKMTST